MLFETNWRAGMMDVSAAIDEVMGERVTVIPAKPPAVNFQAIADHSRAVTVTAVFLSPATLIRLGTDRTREHGLSVPISTRKPSFSFGYGVLPFDILQGYQIKRLCNGEIFEITDVQDDGVSRIVCPVNQMGREGGGPWYARLS
jgi:hypothetical protein